MGGTNGTTPGTPPVFPGQTFSGPSAVDDYNAYAIAHGYVDPTGHALAPYVLFRSTGLLNTAFFPGHASILSQDRKQPFPTGAYNLFGNPPHSFAKFLS